MFLHPATGQSPEGFVLPGHYMMKQKDHVSLDNGDLNSGFSFQLCVGPFGLFEDLKNVKTQLRGKICRFQL
jgi:hypothetical protein